MVILATIAFLGVALLIKQATSVVSVPVASAAAQASPAAAASPSPIPSATSSASDPAGPPARDPTARPYPTFVAVPAAAGATRLVPAGSAPVSLEVTLPDGWARANAAMYVSPTGTASVGQSISAWTVQHVNLFPCRWTTPAFSDELFDRDAEGQAQALAGVVGPGPERAVLLERDDRADRHQAACHDPRRLPGLVRRGAGPERLRLQPVRWWAARPVAGGGRRRPLRARSGRARSAVGRGR